MDLDLDDLEGEMMDRLMKELDGEMGERLMKELDGEEGDKPEKKGSKGGDKFIQKGKGEKEMDGEMDLDLDDLDLDDLEGEMMDRLMKELDGEEGDKPEKKEKKGGKGGDKFIQKGKGEKEMDG